MSNNNNDGINRLEGKLDKLDERLDGVEKILVLQEANLKEHMRRSDLLEEMLSAFRNDTEKELDPIKKHVTKVQLALSWTVKLFVAIAAIAGFILTIIQITKS